MSGKVQGSRSKVDEGQQDTGIEILTVCPYVDRDCSPHCHAWDREAHVCKRFILEVMLLRCIATLPPDRKAISFVGV